MKYLMHHFKALKLFVLAYFVAAGVNNNPADDTAGIKSSIFYQEEILKTTTYQLMEEMFMIRQLMK